VKTRALGACAIAILAVACHKPAAESTQESEPGTPASTQPLPSGSPVDYLAPDELLEGTKQVFGVVLPRALVVKASFVKVVYATGTASVHALAKYFRARLEGGSMREGPAAASFEHVKVRGRPGMELSLRITSGLEGTSVEIRDSTPPPAPALPDEPSRWKAVGLTPQGHLADPAHLD
jgi:hypothetical protein